MSTQTVKWVRTTIAEPFPVFYSHVRQKCHRANDPATEGPFYSAGSSWTDFYTEKAWKHRQWAAEGLRRDGYTVTVDIVESPTWVSGRRPLRQDPLPEGVALAVAA